MNAFNPQPKPDKAIKDKKYVGYVKQLPCVICEKEDGPFGQAPSDFHHTICGRFSGSKTHDKDGIPLCKGHHQTGEHGKLAIHLRQTAWAEKYGPDTDYIKATQDTVKRFFGYTPKGLI